jgi:hypothetical protein
MPTLDAADDDLSVRSFPDYWWSSLPTQSKEKIDTQVNKIKNPKTKSTLIKISHPRRNLLKIARDLTYVASLLISSSPYFAGYLFLPESSFYASGSLDF